MVAAAAAAVVLTAADSGDRFRVRRGGTVQVNLQGSWSAPTSSLLTRVHLLRRGAFETATFTARRSGAGVVRARSPHGTFLVHVRVTDPRLQLALNLDARARDHIALHAFDEATAELASALARVREARLSPAVAATRRALAALAVRDATAALAAIRAAETAERQAL